MKFPKLVSSKVDPKKRQRLIFLCTAFGLFFLSLIVWRYSHQPQHVDAPIITYSTDVPEETPPDKNFVWRGQANDPKKIVITSVGIDAYVQNVGVDQNKQIAVPGNVYIAGWFVDSVRPGEKGLSIIDGHIDGRTQQGAVFKNLPNVSVGDEATIIFGDGTEKHFRVLKTVDVPANKTAASALFSQEPKVSSQLNLITCVGLFDTTTNQYKNRFIVSLELID